MKPTKGWQCLASYLLLTGALLHIRADSVQNVARELNATAAEILSHASPHAPNQFLATYIEARATKILADKGFGEYVVAAVVWEAATSGRRTYYSFEPRKAWADPDSKLLSVNKAGKECAVNGQLDLSNYPQLCFDQGSAWMVKRISGTDGDPKRSAMLALWPLETSVHTDGFLKVVEIFNIRKSSYKGDLFQLTAKLESIQNKLKKFDGGDPRALLLVPGDVAGASPSATARGMRRLDRNLDSLKTGETHQLSTFILPAFAGVDLDIGDDSGSKNQGLESSRDTHHANFAALDLANKWNARLLGRRVKEQGSTWYPLRLGYTYESICWHFTVCFVSPTPLTVQDNSGTKLESQTSQVTRQHFP